MIASVRPVLLEFVFDPIDLRTKRQAALFKEHQEVKEFVFDSLNKAKLTSGFIQGTKMSLPVGFTRTDDDNSGRK